MRPLKLKISGFGTYCKTTEINLEELGKNGLYLITGDTGAGKTTIFDAITFALYGEASGQNRDSSMLRSTYANPEDETYVELRFEHNGKIYNIRRNPAYTRKSKKGDSLVTQSADAELIMPDSTVITKSKSVNEEIAALLGIDKDQFCQIAMISQGEFQKLLSEGTEKRQKIFRKLFKTQKYEMLQEKLKEEDRFYTNQVNERIGLVNAAFKTVVCDEDNVLSIELKKVKETEMPVLEKIEIVNKIIQADKADGEKNEDSLKKNQKELDELNSFLTKLEEVNKAKELEKECHQKLTLMQETQLKIEENLKKALLKVAECEPKEKELTRMADELSDYDELELISENLKNVREILDQNEANRNSLEKNIYEYQNSVELAEREFDSYKDIDAKKIQLNNEIEKNSKLLSELNIFENKVKSLKLSENKLVSAQNEFQTAFESAKIIKEEYEHKNKLYLFEQAGILAENLQENEPCPVCGSLHHPELAKKSENAPTQEELELLERKVSDAESDVLKKQSKAAELNVEVKTAAESAKKYSAELLEEIILFETAIEPDIENASEKITQKKTEINLKLKENEAKLQAEIKREKRKNELEISIPETKEKIEKARKNLQNAEILIAQKTAEIKVVIENYEKIKGELRFESKDEAENAVKKLALEIDTVKKNKDIAQKAFDDNKTEIAALKAKIETLENQINSVEQFDFEILQKEKNDLLEQRNKLLYVEKLISARIITNENALKQVSEHSELLGELQKKQAYVSALSRTANGKIGGDKTKIMLETYIQTTYFDRILNYANARFLVMSDGQYELVRDKSIEKQSQSGLELNVLDHYNSSIRSVKSLSGGESFEASLSLALGLSDEISHSSGGIQIDTMFVDEGFGSLDSETLQKAFKALSGISEGNKLVGIISHVDLLKEKIDKQIIVKKTRDEGSRVTIRL